MGEQFVNPPGFNIEQCFKDSDINSPMIFILSSGVDPISEIEKFALKLGYKYRAKYLSLGEG